ncbi:MAG: copper resistance protein B [Phenylobacterium sp.]|uniref:copper resistance protein B n=1 Tax=Phenylobacterium sp. TaxID=1871053 RepID=UPI0027179935|nr:copper resistance protein B [Phenylobacterium sp.]MDO8409699.1 copper resistance protein B [Phenylobacterium sp.]
MSRLALLLAPAVLAAGPAWAQDAHDPHAHHRAEPTAAGPAAEVDPHAGHDMGPGATAAPGTHAGHAAAPTGPRHGAPASAGSGPAHAADLVFDPTEMARARDQLRAENGDVRTTALIVDRLEAGFGEGAATWLWDVQGWTGGDINRAWIKTEGEGDVDGGLEEAEIQLLYGRAVTPFWDVQLGLRHDIVREAEDLSHLVLGVQGLAPHWWEIDAAAFLSQDGDLTARVEAEYDQRITQRLILQPRLELEASATDVPARQLAAGFSHAAVGLRLRYAFAPEFAPYAGVEWHGALGRSADLVEATGGEADDVRLVIGFKAWR